MARKQHITTTLTCDQCGKGETNVATDKYTPDGWIHNPKLYFDDRYLGRVGQDFCSIDCFIEAARQFLETGGAR